MCNASFYQMVLSFIGGIKQFDCFAFTTVHSCSQKWDISTFTRLQAELRTVERRLYFFLRCHTEVWCTMYYLQAVPWFCNGWITFKYHSMWWHQRVANIVIGSWSTTPFPFNFFEIFVNWCLTLVFQLPDFKDSYSKLIHIVLRQSQ